MDATEGMKQSIKELKQAQDEKTKRVKAAVTESQQSRYTQKEQQRLAE